MRKRGNFVGCSMSKATVIKTPYKDGDNKTLTKSTKGKKNQRKS